MPDTVTVTAPAATLWTGPTAPRDLDEPAVRDHPDLTAWTEAMSDAPSRAGLHGRTLTQVLLGDPVQVLDEQGDWLRVLAPGQPCSIEPAGYPGWMRRSHAGDQPAVPPAGSGWTMVRSRTARCDLADGDRVMLSFGTLLPVEAIGASRIAVSLPDGRQGALRRSDVLHGEEHPHAPGSGPLQAAQTFLGLRYLWGGTSGWGVDCSGLVHLAFRLYGVVVPRDAKDQADSPSLEPVPLDDVRPGDLYFFAEPDRPIHHVGFASRAVEADGTRWMLHAPGPADFVEDAPMNEDRLRTLVSAGRFEVRAAG